MHPKIVNVAIPEAYLLAGEKVMLQLQRKGKTMNLTKEHRAAGTNYTTIWEALTSPVLRVLDEDGNNVADARVRHLLGRHWLLVDDLDGYQILDQEAVERLILRAAQ